MDYEPSVSLEDLKSSEEMISKKEAGRILLRDPHILANADRDKRSNISLTREAALFSYALGVKFSDVKSGAPSTLQYKRNATIEKYVEDYLEEFYSVLASFPEHYFCIHWDGKKIDNNTEGGSLQAKVDRLPILVTGLPTPWLLEVPNLEDETGAAQGQAVCEVPKNLTFLIEFGQLVSTLLLPTLVKSMALW